MGSFTVISRQQRRTERHESERTQLLANSATVTEDWRAEASIGEITDEDKETLKAWLAYNKAVKATAVGEEWPPVPES